MRFSSCIFGVPRWERLTLLTTADNLMPLIAASIRQQETAIIRQHNDWLLLLLLLLAIGRWPIAWPPEAEASSRPNAQLVITQRSVACAVSSLSRVSFCWTITLRLPFTTLDVSAASSHFNQDFGDIQRRVQKNAFGSLFYPLTMPLNASQITLDPYTRWQWRHSVHNSKRRHVGGIRSTAV